MERFVMGAAGSFGGMPVCAARFIYSKTFGTSADAHNTDYDATHQKEPYGERDG
jgi:hypothetical protein